MNILIVEDERVAARRLERLVREILRDKLTSIYCIETLCESERHLSEHTVDVLFLDLNLEGQDGFDLLKNVVAESFQTIIVSANTDRAIESYEYGVLDFIPKPFDKNRLSKAFERLEYAGRRSEKATKVLIIKSQGSRSLIPVERVNFLKGAGDYSEIHLHDGSTALHNKSLESLERILPERFIRIHKSYIADLDQIVNLHVHGGGKYTCKLDNGIILPVSRNRYKNLIENFENP